MTYFAAQNLTTGSVSRQLALFAWPLVLTNLLQTLFSLMDAIFVGYFVGPDAVSAVMIGGQSILFLLTFSLGLTAGSQILIAQFKGAGKAAKEIQTAKTVLTLALAVGIAAALSGYFLAFPALRLLQTPEAALAGARQYMQITSLGLPFAFLYNATAGIWRGRGDAKRPLLFAALATMLHLGFGLLFVGLLSMGILGAALATVTAQVIAALAGAFSLYRHGGFRRSSEEAASYWGLAKSSDILKIGIPFGLQMGLLNLSNLFILRLVNPYGVAASAALGAGSRVTNLLVVPMMAIGNAASAIVGQNLGAGKPGRATATVRWALVYTLTFVAVTTPLTLLFPASLIRFFTDDPEALRIGTQYLTILAWGYAGHAIHSAIGAAVLGRGLAFYSLLSAGTEALIGRMALTWIFSSFWGLSGIFTAQTIAPYLAAALSLIWYFTICRQNAISVDKYHS
ncbi:MAG: MATE family efflux transporter [Oscillospiraceae bacterium]|nr:MATE family efflux transporter [Oscillospiraceae bacterium]